MPNSASKAPCVSNISARPYHDVVTAFTMVLVEFVVLLGWNSRDCLDADEVFDCVLNILSMVPVAVSLLYCGSASANCI